MASAGARPGATAVSTQGAGALQGRGAPSRPPPFVKEIESKRKKPFEADGCAVTSFLAAAELGTCSASRCELPHVCGGEL